MIKVTFEWVDTWQEARDKHPDQPVVLVWFRNKSHGRYMRYHGEFHVVNNGPYLYGVSGLARQWSIAGVWFTPDSVDWMLNNSIALPFSPEDLVLYQLTWGDIRE